MNSKELVLSVMRAQGKADALDLRTRAATMDGTAIIAEEEKAPPPSHVLAPSKRRN